MGRVRSDQWIAEVSDHLCECGCGEFTSVAPRSYSSRGVVKGQPRRFVRGHQFRVPEFRHVSKPQPPKPRRYRLRVVQWKPPVRRPCACGCGALVRKTWAPGHDKRKSSVEYVEDASGCWVWQLGVDKAGYPKYRRKGAEDPKGHRAYFLRYGGEIPEGFHVHHECGNKACVRPTHLRCLSPEAHAALHRDGVPYAA